MPPYSQFNGVHEFAFEDNATLSNAVDMGGSRLMAMRVPPAWEGTTVTFLAAVEPDGDFFSVYDDEGAEVKVTVAPDRIVGVDKVAGKLAALRYLKLRSGTQAAPQPQSSARAFTVMTKR